MQVSLSYLDIGIVLIYFVIVVGVGMWMARKPGGTDQDFFLANRSLGWFVIGTSLFASNISSEHLIGLSADGFRTGLAVGNYEWGACIVLVILATLFVPFYIGSRISTIPEFLERRFGVAGRLYLSTMTIVANVLVRLSVALYAGGIVLQEMFGIALWPSIIILSIATVIYTAVGGLKAVVYTDALQTIILFFGTLALTFIALEKVGGWNALKTQLDSSMFSMVKPASDPEMPWTGLVLGVPILGIWYWCTDQVIVQRVLGAKNVTQARFGALFAAVLKIFPVFLFVLPGLCGRVLFPEIEAKAVFPTLVSQLLPPGVTGLVAAALIAALMSSIDSTLNSTGTLVSLDFYKRFRSEKDSKSAVRVGQITTLVVMIFGILWVNVVASAESLFQYLQMVNAAISPPIAATFLLGVLWPRANHQGAYSALVLGLGVGLALLAWGEIPFLVSAGITFGVSIALIIGVSYLFPAPQAHQVQELTIARYFSGKTTSEPHLKRFYQLVAILLIIMACLWTTFA